MNYKRLQMKMDWRSETTPLCDSAALEHLPVSTGTWKKKGKKGEYKNILSKQPTCRLFSHIYLSRYPRSYL